MAVKSMIRATGVPGTGRHGGIAAALAGFALIAVTALWSGPAMAQADINLLNRLNRLENDVQTLNRQVYRGGAAPAAPGGVGGSGMQSSLATDFEIRLSRLEGELQTLTGKYEEATFGIQQLRERLDKMSSDLDFRLNELEGKLDAAPVAAATPAAPPPKGQNQSAAAATPPKTPQQAAPPPAQQEQPTAAARLPSGSAQDQYNHAFGLLRSADYSNAESALVQFIKNHPDSPLTGNAQYWLAETYYVRGKFKDAAIAFAEGYQKNPKGSKAPDNLLKLGMALGQLNQKSEACLTYAQLTKEFPEATATIKRRADQERGKLSCP